MRGSSFFRMLMASTAVAACGFASASAGTFDVPSGDLNAALDAYIAQSGVQLLVPNASVRGIYTKGAQGNLSDSEALSRILKGTGFVAKPDSSGIVGIVREAHGDAMVTPITLAQAAPQRAAVETVTVTSSKLGGADVQSIPIAITALSQEQLTATQTTGGPDLVKQVPNLTFSKTNFTGYNIQIRGIGTQAISVTTDPAVAVAFNDTPFIRNHFFEQEFYDLSQAEVLRGPQGTLYGRNATAGVVNISSAKPTDQFEAMASADVGNYKNRRFEGMINIPFVGDKVDLRVAGEWTKRDGYTYNETTGSQIDGRDLWSGRITLGWKPISTVQTYLVWEHFQENDDRLRSSKQLCETDNGPSSFTAADGTVVPVPPARGTDYSYNNSYFSQGCLPASLYAKNSFEVPNGFSLPFVSGAAQLGFINTNVDPYASTTQSTNLRDIQSAIQPKYLAKNDTLEMNTSWNVTPSLTFYSDTGYNHDFLWSTEDFNRFDTSPGAFIPNATASGTKIIDADGVFCDPQLGCSDRLVVQDLSEEHAWQLSQELRLASNLSGPFNFSVGGNYLHYETEENYYVFSNTFTMVSLDNVGCTQPYVPSITNNLYCLANGRSYSPFPSQGSIGSVPTESPQYIDPNPIAQLDGNGHNYFLSQNPYVLNSYAGFGEAYYDVTHDLKLTAGLRWTNDEKHFTDIPSQLLVIGYGYPSSGVVDQSWSEFTGRFVANWSPKLPFTDQSMFYASYSHGYKAGGANPPGPVLLNTAIGGSSNNFNFPDHPLTFEPEFINAYEAGTKNSLLDGGLTLNGDVFVYDYKGYQISQIVDRTSINLNFDATVKGAELEATYEPVPGLKFSLAGGYEHTKLNKNQYAIDLMDRTAGTPGWIVVKPDLGESSNCIIPEYVAAALIQAQFVPSSGSPLLNTGPQACGDAYAGGLDPVTHNVYGQGGAVPAGYPGFDPLSVDPNAPAGVNNGLGLPPNNGEGFAKNVGGNELPNAPHYTVSVGADYTLPVTPNWAATLHSDFYWQAGSWARVFNDDPYDHIRGYTNVNLALILTDTSGWQIMGYVKNVFDTTAITGDFLNSDDTGLTTNVFLTDPRLFGVRVTKHFGNESGADFGFSTNISGRKPQVWLTFGGDFARLFADWEKFDPAFALITPDGLPSPIQAEKSPSTSFDMEGKISLQPENSDWVWNVGIRYGRSASSKHIHKSLPPKTANEVALPSFLGFPTLMSCPAFAEAIGDTGICPLRAVNHEFVDSQARSSEEHAILDFTLGKDVGIGLFGHDGKGTLSAGIRLGQFDTRTRADLNADPHYNFPSPFVPEFFGGQKYGNVYDGTTDEKRTFHGIGPEITWDAQQAIWGDEADGEVTLDWGVNGAILLGRQTASIKRRIYEDKCSGGGGTLATCGDVLYNSSPETINRSRSVTVPNLGGYAGLSARFSNAKFSFGYRADTFFDAIDGGQGTAKSYNRGFYGPFASFSVGLGG